MEKTLAARMKLIDSLDSYTLEIGIQASDVAPGEEDGKTLVEIAAENEFGTLAYLGYNNIPSRPWMRTTVDIHKKDWINNMRKIAKIVAKGWEERLEKGWRIFGVEAVSDMQQTLLTYPWKPNAESTIERKGSAQPLFDSGQLVQSHRAVLVKDGKKTLVG